MAEGIGVCRSMRGPAWLLLRKEADGGKWQMVGSPAMPLSNVISEALTLVTAERDFSFSDRRLDPEFTWPKSPAELGKIRNTTTTIFAPERDADGDPIWDSITRDFLGELTRGQQRWRTASLLQVIADWFRDPRGGGGYASFEKPNTYSFNRDLLVRRSWQLSAVAPDLIPNYDAVMAEHARNRRHG